MSKKSLRELIIKDYIKLCKESGKIVTRTEYREIGTYSTYQVEKNFGSFTDLSKCYVDDSNQNNPAQYKAKSSFVDDIMDYCVSKKIHYKLLTIPKLKKYFKLSKQGCSDLLDNWESFLSIVEERFLKIREFKIKAVKSEFYKLSRGDLYRFQLINRQRLFKDCVVSKSDLLLYEISYDGIRKEVMNEILDLKKKLDYDSKSIYDHRNFIVVGDSHGTMIDVIFIKAIDNFVNNNKKLNLKIIHLGHFLDEDGNISTYLEENRELLSKFVIVYKDEEYDQLLKIKERLPELVLIDEIRFPHLVIKNQNLMDDYLKGSIKSLGKYETSNAIINTHKHQLTSLNVVDNFHILASPGCLCLPHVQYFMRSQKVDHTLQSITYKHHHKIYKRRKEIADQMWQRGLIVLSRTDDGRDFHIQHCRYNDGIGCFVYAGKAYHSDKIVKVDKRALVTGDWHFPCVDDAAFNLTDKFAKSQKLDLIVLNGDIADCLPISHHALDKGNMKAIESRRLGSEMVGCTKYIRRALKWAGDLVFMKGNHERFVTDFTDKYPFLEDILNIPKLLELEDLGVRYRNLHDSYEIGNGRVIHGDVLQKLYGAVGTGFSKVRSVYGPNVMMGHGHYPMIQEDVYMAGLLGLYKQAYIGNAPTSWLQGFGLIETYKGHSFMSLLHIIDNKNGEKEMYYNGEKYSA